MNSINTFNLYMHSINSSRYKLKTLVFCGLDEQELLREECDSQEKPIKIVIFIIFLWHVLIVLISGKL